MSVSLHYRKPREHDSSRSSRVGATLVLKPKALVLALAACGLCNLAWAQPSGGVVRAGDIEIRAPQQVDGRSEVSIIQAGAGTQRGVIDWSSFSIPAGERVRFYQPSVDSSVLNRVTGAQSSQLQGQLVSTGQVVLVNPNGILIGPGAVIDTGSFIASTTNITNENFLAGRLRFDDRALLGTGADRDRISVAAGAQVSAADAGLLALVAPSVTNAGALWARLGTVVLGGANRFTLSLNGGLYSFVIDEAAASAAVTHTGSAAADGGRVLITARQAGAALNDVVNTSGLLQAVRAENRDGVIELVAESGNATVAGVMLASGSVSARVPDGTLTVGAGGLSTLEPNGATRGAALTMAARTVQVNGPLATDGGVVTATSSSGGVTFAQPVSAVQGSGLRTGALTVTSAGSIVLPGADVTGDVTLAAQGPVTLSGDMRAGGALVVNTSGAIDATGRVLQAGAGGIQLGRADAPAASMRTGALVTPGSISLASSGSVNVEGPIGAPSDGSAANVTVRAGADSAVQQIRSTGAVIIAAPARGITIGGPVLTQGGSVTVEAAGIRLRGDLASNGGDVSVDGRITVDPEGVTPVTFAVVYSDVPQNSISPFVTWPVQEVPIPRTTPTVVTQHDRYWLGINSGTGTVSLRGGIEGATDVLPARAQVASGEVTFSFQGATYTTPYTVDPIRMSGLTVQSNSAMRVSGEVRSVHLNLVGAGVPDVSGASVPSSSFTNREFLGRAFVTYASSTNDPPTYLLDQLGRSPFSTEPPGSARGDFTAVTQSRASSTIQEALSVTPTGLWASLFLITGGGAPPALADVGARLPPGSTPNAAPSPSSLGAASVITSPSRLRDGSSPPALPGGQQGTPVVTLLSNPTTTGSLSINAGLAASSVVRETTRQPRDQGDVGESADPGVVVAGRQRGEQRTTVVMFGGGGVSRSADLGRSSSPGGLNVFALGDHIAGISNLDNADDYYFLTDSFGRSMGRRNQSSR